MIEAPKGYTFDSHWCITRNILIKYTDEKGEIFYEFNTYQDLWAIYLNLCVTKENGLISDMVGMKFESTPFYLKDITDTKINHWLNDCKDFFLKHPELQKSATQGLNKHCMELKLN